LLAARGMKNESGDERSGEAGFEFHQFPPEQFPFELCQHQQQFDIRI
jgi:hypothetical protein